MKNARQGIMRNAGLLAAIALMVGGLFVVDKISHKSSLTKREIDDQIAEDQKQQATSPDMHAMIGDTLPFSDPLPPEIMVKGDKGNKHTIIVGWVFDAKSMADHATLPGVVGGIKHFVDENDDSIKLVEVNLDVPPEFRSPEAAKVEKLGVEIDGSSKVTLKGVTWDLSGNPGSGNVVWDKVGPALDALAP